MTQQFPNGHAPEESVATRPFRKVWVRAALLCWVVGIFSIVTTLAAAHWYALPRPSARNPLLAAELAAERSRVGADGWAVTHVLYGFCPCSQRIVRHLSERGSHPQAVESVLLVGDEPASRRALSAAKFAVRILHPRELKSRWGLESAPLLIVSDPAGAIRYLGGYSDRKQGPVLRDREIIERLMHGNATAELPLFGCAVSRSLQQMLDPLGLKYRAEEK